jgi:UDP-GlcNAc:undecaprenyl-phosphate GlcNAc-1-phosphate transferase
MDSLALPFLVSFLATTILTPAVIALAWRMGWVARPHNGAWHSRPTALMGGIAIFLGTAVAWLVAPSLSAVWPIAVPAAGVFLLGFIDDRVAFPAHQKLAGQVLAAGFLIAAGVSFGGLPALVAAILSLVWVVGVANAVNYVDNMDGLAAGGSFISAVLLAGYCALVGNDETARSALALAGGCGGFLLYNFHPARVFMGDCGSMFIGFSLAGLALQATQQAASHWPHSLLVAVALLAFPIFDLTLVSVVRPLRGRSILQRGWESASYRLVALGLSQRGAVLALYALSLLAGSLALAATRLPLLVVSLLALLLLNGFAIFGCFISIHGSAQESVPSPAARRLDRLRTGAKQFLQLLVDMQMIPVAFVGAFLLRFEGSLPPPVIPVLFQVLPVVLAVKLVALATCGAYRGVWRCAGMADVWRAVVGSSLGTLLAVAALGLLTGFRSLSVSALVIDWLLFTLLIVATRTGYVALRQLFAMVPPRGAPRVLILGAGTEAMLLNHTLRDSISPQRANVVGIVDDDPDKRGRRLNDVPVLGPLSELRALMETQRITCCLLGVPPHSEMGREILAVCHQQRVAVHRNLESPFPIAERDQLTAA